MSGIASLIGGNSAKTDRKQELDARDQTRSIFNYALPQAEQSQASGSNLEGQAGDYFGRLLRAGRTETTQNAAPALNANLSAADAAKRREALTGTGRTGGTAEADRAAEGTTEAGNADIIAKTEGQEKQVGAQGAEQVGSDQQRQALGLLGLSDQAISQLLSNTTQSRTDSQQIHNASYDRVGQDIGQVLSLPTGSAAGAPSIGGSLADAFF